MARFKCYSVLILVNKIFVRQSLFSRMYQVRSSSHSTVTLLPEVENLLNAGDMKHRKHPGRRNTPPAALPDILVERAYRMLSEYNEKSVFEKALELKEFLLQRRLPMEQEELKYKLKKHFTFEIDDIDHISEVIRDKQNKAQRKRITAEIARWKPVDYDRFNCMAYMVERLAPNYASTLKIFSEIKSQCPSFEPKSYFDFGSGLGTALWAARHTWEKSINECFLVDSSSSMNEIAEELLTDENIGKTPINNMYFRQFLPASHKVQYDLVVSAFSLLDLPSASDRIRVIDTLWRKTKDILVVIEVGNFAGYYSVLDARDYILQIENGDMKGPDSSGAHVLMPCPHEHPCPLMGKKKSCGSFVAYETIFPRHRQIIKKDWISYIVLKKGPKPPEASSWPRIVQPVLKKSKFVICRACCSDGKINEFIVTRQRHGRHTYRCARSSQLGDLLPFVVEPAECVTNSEKEAADMLEEDTVDMLEEDSAVIHEEDTTRDSQEAFNIQKETVTAPEEAKK